MSIKKNAVKGVILNVGGRACSFIIMFFMTPYIVLTLGDESYGIWSIVISLSSYYALADIGFRGAATKYIAQYVALKDYESLNKVIMTSFALYIVIAVVLAIVVYWVSWGFSFFFPGRFLQVEMIKSVVLLAGFTVSFRLVGQVFGATIIAFQRFDISNIISLSIQISQALGVFIVLRSGQGLLGMAWVLFYVGLLTVFAEYFFAFRLLKGSFFSWRNIELKTFKFIFRFGGLSTLARMAARSAAQFENIMIGVFLGPVAVSYFAIPYALEKKTRAMSRSINTVLFPLSSQLDATGDEETLGEIMIVVSRLLLASSLVMASIFCVMGYSLLELWIDTPHAVEGYPVLFILSTASIALVSSNPLRAILRGKAKLGIIIKANVLYAILVLILGFIGIQLMGIVGMALGVAISRIALGAGILPYSYCQVMGYPYRSYLRNVYVPGFVAGFPPFLSAVLVFNYFKPSQLYDLVLQIVFIILIAAPSIFFVCLDRVQRKGVLSLVYSMVGISRLHRSPS